MLIANLFLLSLIPLSSNNVLSSCTSSSLVLSQSSTSPSQYQPEETRLTPFSTRFDAPQHRFFRSKRIEADLNHCRRVSVPFPARITTDRSWLSRSETKDHGLTCHEPAIQDTIQLHWHDHHRVYKLLGCQCWSFDRSNVQTRKLESLPTWACNSGFVIFILIYLFIWNICD